MAMQREPNQQLARLITQSGFSRKGLARRVNELAASHGHHLSCDHTSITRWLAGTQPRDPVPALLAQVLSQRTGRSLTPRDLGLMAHSEEVTVGLRYPKSLDSALETVTRLWRSDMERREFLIGSIFVPGAVAASSRDWLIGPSNDQLAYSGGSTHLDLRDIRQVRALGNEFERLSHEFGAQRIRRHMVNFLQSDVAPLLTRKRGDATGRELFQMAAEFTAAAGYMAVDCNELGLAERYHIQALRLAEAGQSRAYGSQVMATHMGHLSLYAGHPRETVQLAQAAREGGRQRKEPLALAVSWSVEARGYARLGEARACGRALSEAERNFAKSSADPLSYLRYFKHAYLADAFAHCFRDLKQHGKAKHYAAAALKELPSTHVRRRSINAGILAHAHLSEGAPDAAVHYGREAVQLTSSLHSPRAFHRISTLRQQFTPYENVQGVASLLAEADSLLANQAV